MKRQPLSGPHEIASGVLEQPGQVSIIQYATQWAPRSHLFPHLSLHRAKLNLIINYNAAERAKRCVV